MSAYAVILAGGSGSRMESDRNKVLMTLRDVPVIVRAIAPFTALCAGVVIVARDVDARELREILHRYSLCRFVKAIAQGGDTRQASVANGLNALPDDADIVLVHDGARPLVTEAVISRVLRSVIERGSGVAAMPVTDTIKRASGAGEVLETLDRRGLYAMQTPQGFRVDALREAHELAAREGCVCTDDAALVERAGMPVLLTRGDPENIKLTTQDDLYHAEAILSAREEREALK